MKQILLALLASCLIAHGQSSGLFAFDNAVGRGSWSPDQQARTLKELGYDGISYNYTNLKDLAAWIEACREHGITLQGIYVHTFPGGDSPYDPAFKEAIRMLKGSDCVIWMTVREAEDKARNYDDESVAIIHDIAAQAAANDLRVAIYPHAGFYVATAADSLRLAKLADKPNVGPSLNLCHEFITGQGGQLDRTIEQVAPGAVLVSINGLNVAGKHYFGRLDEGDFDLAAFVGKVRAAGYKGPFGVQGYNVPGEPGENLRRSMEAWRKINKP